MVEANQRLSQCALGLAAVGISSYVNGGLGVFGCCVESKKSLVHGPEQTKLYCIMQRLHPESVMFVYDVGYFKRSSSQVERGSTDPGATTPLSFSILDIEKHDGTHCHRFSPGSLEGFKAQVPWHCFKCAPYSSEALSMVSCNKSQILCHFQD